jgi:hypothetical protein
LRIAAGNTGSQHSSSESQWKQANSAKAGRRKGEPVELLERGQRPEIRQGGLKGAPRPGQGRAGHFADGLGLGQIVRAVLHEAADVFPQAGVFVLVAGAASA